MASNRIEVRAVDPYDDAGLRAYHDAFRRGSEADRIDPTTWSLEEVLVHLRQPVAARRLEVYVALDGDIPVGGGDMGFPLLDNTNFVEFDFAVPPEQRRRGVGTALFGFVLERAKANGRSTLATEVNVAAGGERTAPASAFLTKCGLTLRNTEIRRQLKLPLDAARLDALAAKAVERTDGYRIVSWSGPCPEEYAEQYAELKGLLVAEAPTGDSTYEAEKWDIDRLRESERKAEAQGRTLHTSVAVAPDGALAGHTQLAVPAHEHGRAYQWDTLVRDAHRGHRLGLALKAANLRALQAAHQDMNRIETWNAEQNGPMVHVNEEFGFQVIEYCQEWEGER